MKQSWAALEFDVERSATAVVALAKKNGKPETKTVTTHHTVS